MENEKKQVKISTLDDIRNVIAKLFAGPISESVEVRTNVQWAEDGVQKSGSIAATSYDMSPRRILKEGFDRIKNRMEYLEAAKKQAEIEDEDDDLMPEKIKLGVQKFNLDNQFFTIDSLIQRELGGKRKGLRIRWEIPEGIFEYDIYENKLCEVKNG